MSHRHLVNRSVCSLGYSQTVLFTQDVGEEGGGFPLKIIEYIHKMVNNWLLIFLTLYVINIIVLIFSVIGVFCEILQQFILLKFQHWLFSLQIFFFLKATFQCRKKCFSIFLTLLTKFVTVILIIHLSPGCKHKFL